MILENKNVVLGVTGGIAAYKAVDVCSKLVQAEAVVDVIMTQAATHFITPLSFQTISKRPVAVDMFKLLQEADMAHISLAKKADVLLIAPATANTIAKLAHGLADNLLTSTALATTAPLVIAPAMDADMWQNEATQRNVHLLRERGATFVGPGHGRLASGRMGTGRLMGTQDIVAALRKTLGRHGPLAGAHVTVTAGGTQEPLDPVRHLGNRSSGRMGYALAEAARDYGASVKLISAPTCLGDPYGVESLHVRTAAEMRDSVLEAFEETDILIMAAAVADYRPKSAAEKKIKKEGGDLLLPLERTEDILAAVGERRSESDGKTVVGFAAETEDLLENARAKLRHKNLDLIAANDVSASDSGFATETNRVTLLTSDGRTKALPLMNKFQVAEHILDFVVEMRRQHDE
ncbi:MAG: bifunctional phosphopantothenoylcysteine decarboxylase/phosphopantothenate--cysteine ligase CoaBC [Chloroflexota bacterium]|nr:bifunctional phosphopantothenoylcysteine decarboxylase/phosphopantothenate--cysteine ligase CoaBC [Chloroflexota bacterium]